MEEDVQVSTIRLQKAVWNMAEEMAINEDRSRNKMIELLIKRAYEARTK
jgi:hypothetical protein